MITFKELKNRNFDKKGIGNQKFQGVCECGAEYTFVNVKRFLRRKVFTESLCKTCYNAKYQFTEEWRKKNSEAQLIAQNRPEVKEKMAKSISACWTDERKENAAKFLKNRMETDKDFKKKALKNLEWTSGRDKELFLKNLKKGFGCGGKTGIFKGLTYLSLLELSFILTALRVGDSIKNYDLEGIKYKDEKGKQRVYWPDFIIGEIIYEIKCKNVAFQKNYDRNLLKFEAGKRFAKKNKKVYRVVYLDCNGLNYSVARRIHNENSKKDL
jgi:hypothetical protein